MHNSNAYDFYFAYTLIVNSNSQLEKKFFFEAKRPSLLTLVVINLFQGYRRRWNEGSRSRRSRLFPPRCRQKSESRVNRR